MADVNQYMDRVEKNMDEIRGSLADVRERLARIEASSAHTVMEEVKRDNLRLWEKINALEADRHARIGAFRLGEFLKSIAPWLFATGLAVWATLSSRWAPPP